MKKVNLGDSLYIAGYVALPKAACSRRSRAERTGG